MNPIRAPYVAPTIIMYRTPSTNQCFNALPTPPPKRPTSAAPRTSGIPRTRSNSRKLSAFAGVSAYRKSETASNRKVNPNPSFPPASEEMNSRRCRRTYLSANGPLAIACDRMGSVHVTHEPMINAASCTRALFISIEVYKVERSLTAVAHTNERLGTMSMMHEDVITHPIPMRGSRQKVSSMERCFMYRFGNWYPTLTN